MFRVSEILCLINVNYQLFNVKSAKKIVLKFNIAFF